MRPRSLMLCSALSAVALAVAPGLANAAPKHNHGLTINATPNPTDAGDPVLIYGQLLGNDVSGKTIVLYHHISGTSTGYTVIQTTKTDRFGFYDFVRNAGVVDTNRSWFAREADQPNIHSRTVYQRVRALVTLHASTNSALTNHSIDLYGMVRPNHAGERVLLQVQSGGSTSDDWTTIKTGRLGPGSHYSIDYRWATPGTRSLRVLFPGDNRNLRAASDELDVTVQQTQNPYFTINTAKPSINWGDSAQITGTLYKGGTTTPEPNTPIMLCHGAEQNSIKTCDQAGATGNDGSYSFTVQPTSNQWYRVETTNGKRQTARLFLGVHDLITLTGSTTGVVGQADTFTGTVTPNKAGHLVYLQRLESDGDWHDVGITRVKGDGSYSVKHVFGTPGTKQFRTRILGGEVNEGAVSTVVTVTVTLPAVSTLTPAT